ncbi:hypothetical protein GUJ93_ZPchr0013g37201 [Zizania palustris]|uniref:Uncharacterized protein n=1 Tax=Zizania palustris TaxID=103762 RepID=A0A8J5X254_ZIZPA|nr:hypothetical protein GUJ93_ZPchr0013g37201 [Zizania palustris]
MMGAAAAAPRFGRAAFRPAVPAPTPTRRRRTEPPNQRRPRRGSCDRVVEQQGLGLRVNPLPPSCRPRLEDDTLVPICRRKRWLVKWIGVKRSNLRGFQCRREESSGGRSIEVVVEGLNPVFLSMSGRRQRAKEARFVLKRKPRLHMMISWN